MIQLNKNVKYHCINNKKPLLSISFLFGSLISSKECFSSLSNFDLATTCDFSARWHKHILTNLTAEIARASSSFLLSLLRH